MADPEILKINAGFVLRKKSSRTRTRLPPEVIALLTPEGRAKHLAETEDPMDVDEDPVQPAGLNPNEANEEDGLDELIFVFEDGAEQVVNVAQPMDVDVGIGDIVVNVNEAGDFNVQGGQA